MTEDSRPAAAMGELGSTLISPGDTLLTHCNAGALATAGMGTALAPIFVAHRSGKGFGCSWMKPVRCCRAPG